MVPIQQQKVVIIGHSTTLRLGMVRAIGELGCKIDVIVLGCSERFGLPKPFDCYSKYISQVFFCSASNGNQLVDILLNECRASDQKVILFPTSDFSAIVIDNHKSVLSEYFLFPHISQSFYSVQDWMDKSKQKELARKVGLNVPNSHVIIIKDRIYSLPAGIDFPCFTKPTVSIEGGKAWFRRCDSQDELCRMLNSFGEKNDASILVEDYKEIEQEYAVIGFSDGNKVIIPGIVHLEDQTLSHYGVAMTGTVYPVGEFENIIAQFKSFVLQMGFVGVFDIDFYFCKGRYYFGEMNLRPGASGYAITKLGVNLPAMLVRNFRGEDISEMKELVGDTATFVNERMCSDDWYIGFISSKDYREKRASAKISFVKDKDDRMPYKMFELEHSLLRAKKIIKRIIKQS